MSAQRQSVQPTTISGNSGPVGAAPSGGPPCPSLVNTCGSRREYSLLARTFHRRDRESGQIHPFAPGSAASHRPKSLWRPALHYVVGNFGALLVGLAVAYVALMRGGQITSLTIRTGDFIQYFSISRLILDGHGGAIYDPQRLSHIEAMLVYPLSMQHGVLPYLYPPYFALAVSPLAALPYGGAYLLWFLVNCLLLVVMLFALEQYGGLSGRRAGLARLACICSLPIVMTLALGQVSILIATLLVLCFFALRSGRQEVAGAALALALIKPPYVLPLLVVLLAQRRWRALMSFGASCLCLLLLPIPVLGISIDRIYAQLLATATRWQGRSGTVTYHHVMIAGATYDPHVNNSIAGAMQLLVSSPTSKVLAVGLSAAILALLVRCAWRSPEVDLPFGLAIVAALLINPHVLVHDLTLLLIPVWIALRYRREGPPRLGWLLFLCFVCFTAGYPLSYVIPVQLSVLAMFALGLWLFLTGARLSTGGHLLAPVASQSLPHAGIGGTPAIPELRDAQRTT